MQHQDGIAAVGSQGAERPVMQPQVDIPAIRELEAGHGIRGRPGPLDPVCRVRLDKKETVIIADVNFSVR